MPYPKIDMSGKRIGRLTVLRSTPGKWLCRCDCGIEKEITGAHLRSGRVNSCGCLHQELRKQLSTKHGFKHSDVYAVWENMRQRCYNKNRKDWKNYGGRGIIVCQEWHSIENFVADMGPPPHGYTLDRIDVNGNYEKQNCRWVTRSVQNRNRRNNRLLTMEGVTKPLVDWCDELGLKYWTVHARLRRGATSEGALRHG